VTRALQIGPELAAAEAFAISRLDADEAHEDGLARRGADAVEGRVGELGRERRVGCHADAAERHIAATAVNGHAESSTRPRLLLLALALGEELLNLTARDYLNAIGNPHVLQLDAAWRIVFARRARLRKTVWKTSSAS